MCFVVQKYGGRIDSASGLLSPIAAIAVGLSVLEVEVVLAEHGLAYCDFKPANIVTDPTVERSEEDEKYGCPVVKLIDYGGVTPLDEECQESTPNYALGLRTTSSVARDCTCLAVTLFEIAGFSWPSRPTEAKTEVFLAVMLSLPPFFAEFLQALVMYPQDQNGADHLQGFIAEWRRRLDLEASRPTREW